MLEIVKKATLVILELIDGFLFLACIPLISILMLTLGKIRSGRSLNKGENLLLLASGSSIGQILEKFGSFEPLFEFNPNGYFNKVIFTFPLAPKTQKVCVRNDMVVFDYKPIGGFYLLSLSYYVLKLLFIINKEEITLLRSTAAHVTGPLGLILSRLTGLPFCVSIHTDYDLIERIAPESAQEYFGSRKLAKKLRKFVLSHTRMVMPISEYLVKYAINNGAKHESIRVIPHGIDPSPFLRSPDPTIKKELGIEDQKVISFVGRLSKGNCAVDVIKIASEVCRQRQDVVFLVVADGEDKDYLEHLSWDLGLSNNVMFLGFYSRIKVAQIMLLSEVNLCFVSGFVLIEAAISGKPIVAYDLEWQSELVKNNETGLLVPEGDIEGAAAAILKLLDNPELSIRLGENARRLAMERHSLENTSKVKVKWYEELIGDSRICRANEER